VSGESNKTNRQHKIAEQARNDYDLEVDCTESPYGKLYVLIELPDSAAGGSRGE
jgi:hypothetical protein